MIGNKVELTVVLPAEAWNVVVTLVGRGPYAEVKPVIEALLMQLNNQPPAVPEPTVTP